MSTLLENTMARKYDLNAHFEEYQIQGYTIFEGFWDAATMDALVAECDRLMAEASALGAGDRNWWIGNALERSPALMLQMLKEEPLLDFAEKVIGPFVQLDNLTIASFPIEPREQRMGVSAWHRDRWAHMPIGQYERPLAVNAIAYGQDMNEELGPLRVLPGSHITPVKMSKEERSKPHPDEVLVFPKKGDMIFTHNGLFHSGTKNVSGNRRYFFSVYLNNSWLRPTDSFGGPNCQFLLRQARERNDRRWMRFLGEDPLAKTRNNWGFFEDEETAFARFQAEDAEALQPLNPGVG